MLAKQQVELESILAQLLCLTDSNRQPIDFDQLTEYLQQLNTVLVFMCSGVLEDLR